MYIDNYFFNTAEVRIRFADTDKMAVVYNGKYFEFFEVGRTELMRNLGLPYIEFERAGYFLPVIESYIKFSGSSFYDDIINIETRLENIIRATVKFEYNILRSNTSIAKGYTVHSFMNQGSRSAVRPPKIFIDLLNSHLNK